MLFWKTSGKIQDEGLSKETDLTLWCWMDLLKNLGLNVSSLEMLQIYCRSGLKHTKSSKTYWILLKKMWLSYKANEINRNRFTADSSLVYMEFYI